MVVVASCGLIKNAGERPEDKTAGEKGVRFGVIAAEQLVSAELKSVIAADLGEVVGEFVAPQDGEVGQENIGSKLLIKLGICSPTCAGALGITLKL